MLKNILVPFFKFLRTKNLKSVIFLDTFFDIDKNILQFLK